MKTILFENGTIIPMTGRDIRFIYMGIKGDTIEYLGNEKPAKTYDEVVDLGGKFIFPTLCDSHMHLLYSVALAASSFNICEITKDGIVPDNMEGIEKALRGYAEVHPGQTLIIVNQYITPAIKERRMPEASELDLWCNNKEVIIFSIDGHSCALSSALMKKLNIKSDTGILSGEDYDMSQGEITNYIASSVSLGSLAKGLANFQNECFKYGISKVCALDGEDTEDDNDTLLSLLSFLAQRMDIKVRLFPQYMNYEKTEKIQKNLSSGRMGGCSKWELDGSVGSYSAAFYHPFLGQDEPAKLYYSQEYIDAKIKEGLGSGFTMTCHAIGTKAIDEICKAYKTCEPLIPGQGPMCRIDHFEFPSKEALEFIKSHRLAITMQPGYAYLDKRYIKSYVKHLSPEDIELVAPMKDLNDAGVVILGSSDSPVQTINPYDQMLGMMDYYKSEQSLDAYDALKTYTYNSYLALAEKSGCLMEGNSADFFICEKDITNLGSDEISGVRALKTYINGRPMKEKTGMLSEFFGLLFKKPHLI